MDYKYENNDYLAKVPEEDIRNTEKVLNRRLPEELRDFLINHGCGIIEEDPDEAHRLFSPSEILDFVSFTGYYSIIEDKDFFCSIRNDGIVFMEYDQETFFWISTKTQTYGRVFFYNDCIASSFNELVEKIHKHIELF